MELGGELSEWPSQGSSRSNSRRKPTVRNFSARFAGVGATDAKNNKLMVELLSDLPDVNRGARYVAVLALMEHEDDATPILCQGTWDGEIVLEPQGEQGFGYDPHFFVPEKGCTAAQLDPQEKNALSHRGKAMAALLPQLKREP